MPIPGTCLPPLPHLPAEAQIPGHAPLLCLRSALHLQLLWGACSAAHRKVLQLPSWGGEAASGLSITPLSQVIQFLLGPEFQRKLGRHWHPLPPKSRFVSSSLTFAPWSSRDLSTVSTLPPLSGQWPYTAHFLPCIFQSKKGFRGSQVLGLGQRKVKHLLESN